MLRSLYISIYAMLCLLLCASCLPKVEDAQPLHMAAAITPDYSEVTMPCDIAAPTFTLADSLQLDDTQAVFTSGNAQFVVASDDERGICIDNDDWHTLTSASDTIHIRIQGKRNGRWVEYDTFCIYISTDTIDSYLAYRLIEPGYEVWNKMGIYQRCLANYDESAIITNDATNGGCMNCHSFCRHNPEIMLHHQRLEQGGTYFRINGSTRHIDPKPSFVYPQWHPSGRYVAFSTNSTKQVFHTTSRNRIEVFDYSSDVIVYDVENDRILTTDIIHSATSFETFPSWSPDGKTLYFCSADSVSMPDQYDNAHYSLCSIAFDTATQTFDDRIDTLYNANVEGGSASFPRVSPDGRYLVFTHHAYGNFSIWHHDANLWMIDLQAPVPQPVESSVLNSPLTESYHSWSSTGRWIVFSTRREDGLYTRPYISHFDGKGHFAKPFPLPQEDAGFSIRFMKSYNIPEFVTGKVKAVQ